MQELGARGGVGRQDAAQQVGQAGDRGEHAGRQPHRRRLRQGKVQARFFFVLFVFNVHLFLYL